MDHTAHFMKSCKIFFYSFCVTMWKVCHISVMVGEHLQCSIFVGPTLEWAISVMNHLISHIDSFTTDTYYNVEGFFY